MGPETVNRNKASNFYGPYAGRDLYITMYQDSEREFIVTHNADIKPTVYFIGRETELEYLRRRTEEGRKSVLISGMGGIGKTQICRKLFDEYSKIDKNRPFSHIGYIEYDGDMNNSLHTCLKFKKQERQEDNLEAAWRELEYLASDGKLLLFVDNVNKPISADSGLQRLKEIPGALVLTSRRTAFSKEFEPYRIGFLDMEQCKEIYRFIRYEGSKEKVPEEEIADLEYIIGTQAAGHTLTIEFLAHLARTKLWTTKDLRDKLTDKGFQLEYKDDEDKLVNIQKSYEALYDLSELSDAEQNILEAFSVFPYIPLKAKICNEWLLADAGVSEDDDALVGLYRKGWLQFDIKQQSYAMHPVFAQFIYDKCKPEYKRHHGLIEACRKSLEIPENGSALECQKLVPFAEKMIEKLGIGKDIRQVGFISDCAYLLSYIAEYTKAESMYKMDLEIKEKVLGKEHPNTAASYNNLARVYEDQGEYKKAEELYEKSLQIRESVLGENHLDTATTYNDLASVYDRLGKCKKAEELYEKCLQIREDVLGENHLDTATTYNNMAVMYKRQREYEKAEKLYEKSLRTRKSVLGENHIVTANSYNNMAVMYRDQGEYKKAEELYEKCLRIRESVLGENHPDTARSYNNLAGAYKGQNEYKKAKELYEKSLQIREKVLGENHPDTIMSYNNLGGLYLSQKKYELALANCFKAYKTFLRVFGVEYLYTKTTHRNMQKIYVEWKPEGDFEQWLEEKMKE